MKGALPLVFGLAGGVIAALAVRVLEPEPAPVRVAPAERPAKAPPAEDRTGRDAEQDRQIADLERRLDEIARRAGGEQTKPPPSVAQPRGEGEGSGEGDATAAGSSVESVVQGLKGRKLVPADTDRLFEWLTNHQDRIGDVIAAIQKEIVADPSNPELQVALATAYVAELWNNTPQGPQQGIVWMKASAAYDAAIKLEPEHWTARFGKAFGTSMAPEFLGMRPEAIRQFEELLDIQKRRPPEPHFADTYFRLGTLYKDAGNVEKAREIWNAGLLLFPDNTELKGTIEASTKR